MNLPFASTMIPLIGAIFAGLVVGWVLPDPWRARGRKGYIVPPAPKGGDDKESPAGLRERAELAEREAEMLQSQLHSLRAAQRAHAERDGFGESEGGPSELDELREKLEAADQDREQLQAQLEELQSKTRQQQRKLDEAADRLVEFERERMKKGEGLGRRSAPKKDEPRSTESDGDRQAKWVEPLIAASRGDAKDTKSPAAKPEPAKTFDPEPAGVALATAEPPVDLELERDELELSSGFSEPLASPGDPVALEIQRSEPLSVQTDLEETDVDAEAEPTAEAAPEVEIEMEPEATADPEPEVAETAADDPILKDPRDEGRTEHGANETDSVELPEDLPDLEIDAEFETPVEAESQDEPEGPSEPESNAEAEPEAEPEVAEVAEETPEPTETGADHDLDAIDGLKPDVIERLGLIGVKSTLDLVRKGAKRSGVNGLASGMSLHTNEVDRWVSAADLLRIERMRHQDVNDLVAKNVTSVQVLAGSDPANLVKRLGDAGSKATESVVQEWIARAKQLKPIIRW